MRRRLPDVLTAHSLTLAVLLAGCRTQVPTRATPATPPPSAVRLVCINFDRIEAFEASAFFISADGLLVTCAHVIEGVMPIGVTLLDGSDATVAYVEATDPDADLALLRIRGRGFDAIPLADAPADARGRLRAVTKAGLADATYVGPHDDPDVGRVILFAAPGLGVGASGGALVDGEGRCIGVIRGGVEDNAAECVAVPVARLRALMAQAGGTPREL